MIIIFALALFGSQRARGVVIMSLLLIRQGRPNGRSRTISKSILLEFIFRDTRTNCYRIVDKFYLFNFNLVSCVKCLSVTNVHFTVFYCSVFCWCLLCLKFIIMSAHKKQKTLSFSSRMGNGFFFYNVERQVHMFDMSNNNIHNKKR